MTYAPHDTARMLRAGIKGIFLFVFLGVAVYLFHYGQTEGIFQTAWINEHIKDKGFTAWGLFFCLTALFSAIGFPRQVLATMGGYAFGAFEGVILVSFALVLGCSISFFYARLLAKTAVRRLIGRKLQAIENFLLKKTFLAAVAIRFMPVGNNTITSMLGGISEAPALSFIAGSGVGYLPQTVIFCLLGSGVAVEATYRLWISFGLLIVATAIGVLAYRHFRRNMPRSEDAQD